MTEYEQVSVEDVASTEKCLNLVALLVVEMDDFLDADRSASLVLLNYILSGLTLQENLVVRVALRIQIISHLESLFNGSHSEIAHLRELSGVLMHCLVEALSPSVRQRAIVDHVLQVDRRQVFQVILPPLQHLFCARDH